jgi:hypothetical protein
VEDENADRVYVPGTNARAADRDVEPFWPPEELNAPVHGGKPVPQDAPQAFPLPPAPPLQDGGVLPADGPARDTAAGPAEIPPATPPPAPIPRPAPGQEASAQAWPNIPPAAPRTDGTSRLCHVSPAPPTSDPRCHGE